MLLFSAEMSRINQIAKASKQKEVENKKEATGNVKKKRINDATKVLD